MIFYISKKCQSLIHVFSQSMQSSGSKHHPVPWYGVVGSGCQHRKCDRRLPQGRNAYFGGVEPSDTGCPNAGESAGGSVVMPGRRRSRSGVEPASLCLIVGQRGIPPDSPKILQKIAENVPTEPLPRKQELNQHQQVACWTPSKSLVTREKPFNTRKMQNLVSFG